MRCGRNPKSAAVPATVSDEPAPIHHWDFPGRRHHGDDPRARRPAVASKKSDSPAGVPGKEHELDHSGISPDDGAATPASDPLRDVTVLVCSTCRDETGSDARPRAGALLAENVCRAAGNDNIRIRTVECLGNCKRRLSAAILRKDCWSYVFGDLSADSGPDLIAGAKLFATSADGLIPWRGRPESLKRGLVARIPPLDLLKD